MGGGRGGCSVPGAEPARVLRAHQSFLGDEAPASVSLLVLHISLGTEAASCARASVSPPIKWAHLSFTA